MNSKTNVKEANMLPKYWAIIPAAGIGTRMKADRPKQYLMLEKKPILTHVLDLFSAHPKIERVIVALHPQDHWWPTLLPAHPEKIFTVIGGKERVDSVLLSLQFLASFADENDFVLVHDAVRPFLKSDMITTLINETKDHPVGGLLGLPMVDTIKKVNAADEVEKTISREGLWRAQTPQCFRYGILKSAIEKALSENVMITDESSAIEYSGLKPKMILGSASNIKITFLEDLAK